jgi:hypothetical protein
MYRVAAYQVGTLTLAPSGSATINPILSDQAFTSVCLSCVPLGSGPNYKHTVQSYIDGVEIEEYDHTTDGKLESTIILFQGQIFPPNVNVQNRADMKGFDPSGVTGITLTITNNETEQASFTIYATFEMFSGTNCRPMVFSP